MYGIFGSFDDGFQTSRNIKAHNVIEDSLYEGYTDRGTKAPRARRANRFKAARGMPDEGLNPFTQGHLCFRLRLGSATAMTGCSPERLS
jgi:hypothetical protein